ncbi:restriction endonuclease subunit S [Flavobacterium capsici]|uniref:Restriction endonuclease subunit S n=1 Tax=Flavobacterium capsici TaxID=3075618 RepID=A0AA96ESN1_9FLAO|nr:MULTISPECIES: restriction endonuclease subunit S [unclassified Flavobacterium]WNM17974.1 restriction endonuclease subunit S [Flavobacterium sp. PMR2A8]WNM22026.1 restriction endonuclease subunit S [Flavobacterium sp. PMTSA4]
MEILQPVLRFPGFEDKWSNKNLGSIFTITSASRVHKNEWTESGVRFFRSSDVVSHFKGNDNTKAYISFELYESLSSKIGRVKKGDILITGGGSIGIPYLISDNEPLYFKDADLLWIKNVDKINGYFLYSFFLTESFTNYLKSISHIGTIAHYTVIQAKNTPFNFPSLEEQTKIANFLSSVDEKLNLLKEKKELLEEYKKGIMQKIFNQELRFKDDNGSDFEDWKLKRLKDFMVERNVQLPKNDKYPLMSFVANKGVTEKGDRYNREFLVNDEENKKYKQTEYGDFIYSSNNLETGSIGLNNYGSASISPVYSIFKINELCDYKFISNFFSRKEFISKMTKFRQGVMYGQWRIHEKDFLQIEENFPCLKEQTKIANFLSAIDEKIELVFNQIEDTQEYKKGLLQQMFV